MIVVVLIALLFLGPMTEYAAVDMPDGSHRNRVTPLSSQNRSQTPEGDTPISSHPPPGRSRLEPESALEDPRR